VQESSHLVIVGDLIKTDKNGEEGVEGNEYFLGYNDPEAHKESDYWIKQGTVRLKTENDKRAKQRSRPLPSLPNDSQNEREHERGPAI
jgi:hypothetical protein